MKKVVIALGGNALGITNEEQIKNVEIVAKKIVSLIEKGYEIIITHGNGPQVGKINSALNDIPFPECNAMSQGYIGYHIEQLVDNELRKRGIKKECTSVITRVVVDKNDDAFNNPTKPIGKFLTKEESEKLEKETGYVFKEDAGRGYRRVVASPKPIEIVEINTIKSLIDNNTLVIACGGGGIPVIKENNVIEGIPAVIDKDLASSLLAKKIDADELIILTNVDKVALNYNTENETKIDMLTIEEAQKYLEEEQFAKGSMLPKVLSCISFVQGADKKAIITSIENADKIDDEKTGTTFKE